MIQVDNKMIDLVEKIRRALKKGALTPDNFPMDEIGNLIECTLGTDFWECIGSQSNYGFGNIPEIYKECLSEALERKDMEECERLLHLFECIYQAFYAALNEEEKIFRQKPYRQMIIDLGTVNSQMQYRLHRERQKEYGIKNERGFLEGRGVVYTCMFGETVIKQPEEVSMHVDYICFTDNEEKWGKKDGVWQYRAMEKMEKIEGVEDAKEELAQMFLESKCKIMAHVLLKEYDYSIWIDPDVIIVGDVLRFCKVYGEGRSFLSFPSAKEDCIYENMSVTQMGTDELNIKVRKMMLSYRKEGYPEHYGSIDGRVMVRNHKDSELCRIMEEWWEEVKGSFIFIDNVFNYIAWKNKFPFSICNLFVYENPYFKVSDIDLDTHEEL